MLNPRIYLGLLSLFIGFNVAYGALGKETIRKDEVKVDPRYEPIIKGALKFLAKQQKISTKTINGKKVELGYWGVSREEARYPVAMTGYTLMAFMAAGNLPGEGPYGREVARGMEYLLDTITDSTGIYGKQSYGQYMYGHGIATIALAELYGQTRNQRMRVKLQKVIDRIVACQNSQGGWRYRPVKRDADISVTVLQCVALRAAKNSGLDVPQRTIQNAIKYVERCYNSSSGGFAYQPGSSPGFARTAATIYSLQVCGKYKDSRVTSGSLYLKNNFRVGQEWFVYGNFYAAPAQYMVGGKTWKDWYAKIGEVIFGSVNSTRKTKGEYYWDSAGRGGVGPVFTTAVYTMILAMPYHYIPLYQR